MWGIYLLLKRVGVSLSIASSLAATEAVQVELAGEAGPYQVLTWKKQWPGCEYEDGVKEGRFTLVEKAGGQWLRAFFPQGAVGPNEGGGGWRMPFARRDEAELTYQLCFEEGFDFKKGGKLPGLCGGPKTITGGDAVSGRDGFSVRLMWRMEGRGQAYVYHMDQPSKYGDEFNFPEGFRFSAGVPVTIRMVLRINTPSKKDGHIRIWTSLPSAAEQLQLEKTGLRFRQVKDYAIDSILFNTFHGGSDKSWGPAHDCAVAFRGFAVR
jgi:hypothetical protein